MRAGIKISVVIACVLTTLTACTGPYAELVFTSSGETGKEAGSLIFNNSDTLSYTLQVKSNTSWRIKNVTDWVDVSETSGVDDGTVKFTVSYNTTGSDRSAQLSIVTDDVSEKSTVLEVFQPAAYLHLSESSLSFGKTGGIKSVTLASNTVWNVTSSLFSDRSSVGVSPASGTGSSTLSVQAEANATRREVLGNLFFEFAGSLKDSIEFSVEPQLNHAPSKPEMIYPAEGDGGVSRSTRFEWQPSSDSDGDDVSYFVQISADGEVWDTVAVTKQDHDYPCALLDADTGYYWTVAANDSNYQGITCSDTLHFITGTGGVIADGSYSEYLHSDKESPCEMVFMGDGFIDEDLMEGNSEYDRVMAEAIGDFFSCEPMKSYKEYFDVWIVYAESKERGWSSPSHINNTAFRVSWAGGNNTALSCNAGTVFEYARKVPAVTDLNRTPVVVISNEKKYAGTCAMWREGGTLAMVPRCPEGLSDDDQCSFESVLLHESAGHGFGRLADEYVANGEGITQMGADSLRSYQSYGLFMNVSVTTDTLETPWKDFLGRQDYPLVGYFEGGYCYAKGVWRSEEESAMVDNIHYFPAIGRYMMVKRIFETAGEEFSLEKFMEKDKVRSPESVSTTRSHKFPPEKFVPLSPPVVYIGSPPAY
ncbi:MAG: M64 family metallo-endopeptidase [Bacteroidales bacterium]|jgi:hypothetical protein|nr:M64 family metallo-endopeptidase [Bacteroidales bacterium]MCI2121200.1 M64 family metallo-endopeptidase [Bacteroidales bacterium]MCI2145012.1 M64 family metallo-endopeptidase [Bacteroidales bacterium]